MHRVLWDPPEPGHPPVPRALPGPGRLAGGAQHGDDSHRQHHGQQRLGGRSGGLHQAGERQHQVSIPSADAGVALMKRAGIIE